VRQFILVLSLFFVPTHMTAKQEEKKASYKDYLPSKRLIAGATCAGALLIACNKTCNENVKQWCTNLTPKAFKKLTRISKKIMPLFLQGIIDIITNYAFEKQFEPTAPKAIKKISSCTCSPASEPEKAAIQNVVQQMISNRTIIVKQFDSNVNPLAYEQEDSKALYIYLHPGVTTELGTPACTKDNIILVDSSLLAKNEKIIQFLVAHEASHVKHRDDISRAYIDSIIAPLVAPFITHACSALLNKGSTENTQSNTRTLSNWVGRRLIAKALGTLWQRHCESRADRESAQSGNTDGGIAFFNQELNRMKTEYHLESAPNQTCEVIGQCMELFTPPNINNPFHTFDHPTLAGRKAALQALK